MKTKTFLIFLFSTVFLCQFPTLSHALINSDVKKAKEFMEAGMYPQAIELLNKRINDKPTDAEAHFQLGICYINTGNYSKADERFGSSVRLEPDRGYKIGDEYKRVGDESLKHGRTSDANKRYRMAIKYQPDLKDKIAQDAFNQGKTYFNQGNYRLADSTFGVAASLNSSINQQISDMYFNLGNSTDGIRCIEYYQIARKYSSSHNWEIGQRLVENAKAPKISEKEKKKYKKEAATYLSKAEMNKAFPPDFKIYKAGNEVVFKLKKGQFIDHWIRPPWETHIRFQSKYGEYEIHTRNGKVYPKGNFPEKLNDDFKVFAVTDCDMRIVFKDSP